ncbi:MAG: hypothetical protein JKY50_09405 [Oleispira sp.]|nr:hypothetical protein [Oleispira sp.]
MNKQSVSTHLPKAPAAILLIAAATLMQIHSIEFWMNQTGDYSGILWSLLLEGAALWLWASHNGWKSALGLVASLLVLAGPLYQVSSPAITQWQNSNTLPGLQIKQETVLLAEVVSLESSLAQYNDNSASRVGWSGRIDETKADLKTANAELKQFYKAQEQPVVMGWQSMAVIAMQAISLVLFQLLIVLTIRSLSAEKKAVKAGANKSVKKKAATTPRLAIAA